MNENNNHLIEALNTCIEDLVKQAIDNTVATSVEAAMTEFLSRSLHKHLDDYIASRTAFTERVQQVIYDDRADKFDDNVKEVVRNMTFTVEVSRYS